MAYLLLQSEHFLDTLGKLIKKDRPMYERVKKKMAEILENPSHYKPLSNLLKHYQRAHVGHFVVVFRTMEEQKAVKFVAYGHHDDIYELPFNE